ncbi:hypothetical protein CC80DRAFT_589540 [Byssothecium circinans]|uniref:Uncharacterized protein n=1 Tax=Byssothecium circinans TaxID=147558 RepID=A0A6A5U8U9_9PLEO|nr:hypothetical protein CC80DRAFT_589540 [Byssothecium circinans]
MGRGKRTQKAAVVDGDVTNNKENERHFEQQYYEQEMEIESTSVFVTPAPRASKFVEATMNSRSSIHPPPNEQWEALGIDHLIQGFNEENSMPAVKRKVSRTPSSSAVPMSETAGAAKEAGAHEGALGRFSRAVASWFGAGGGLSLGKRKAGNDAAEKSSVQVAGVERAADAKERAEAAYAEAKARGLLPAPKVFVRPTMRAQRPGVVAGTSTPSALPPTPSSAILALPRTPTLYKSPSKKDLHKQKKLSKRVSDLEHRLAEARKELALTLSPANVNAHPVPPVPVNYSSPIAMESPLKQGRSAIIESIAPPKQDEPATPIGKIVKKRKAVPNSNNSNKTNDDATYKPIPTDSDYSHDSEHELKRPKTSSSNKLKRKPSSRLVKKKTATVTKEEEVVIVVPDASVGVPPIPSIPKGVDGKRSKIVNPDGYGGLEHEMF